MPASASASRSGANARKDVLAMLKDDHKQAKKNFKDFEKLDPSEDAEQCQELVEQTCAMLVMHTTLEEELLYPAAREAIEADLIDEAEVEHGSAKQLIEQLQGMSPDDDKYAATFKVLGEYVQHHVKEEETEMFPQLEKAKQIDWDALCDEMNGRRAELLEELMPEEAAAEEAADEAQEASDEDLADEDAPARAPAAAKPKAGARKPAAEPRAQAADRSQDEDAD